MTGDFKEDVDRAGGSSLCVQKLETLQVNVGDLCNQQCIHCHVGAGPGGKKVMGRAVMKGVLDFLGRHEGLCLDITGGCPEMNPDIRWLLENTRRYVGRMMMRTNLTILLEKRYEWAAQWYRDNDVVVIGSLPCYTEENVDRERGSGVFAKSIRVIRMLNEMGYGDEGGPELDLVYNPGGGFLCGGQSVLEADYKRHLLKEHGIVFTRLYTITNAAIGRFAEYLRANGELEEYERMLIDGFNPEAAESIMCRSLVSIGWDGAVYNCDFNQALGIAVTDKAGKKLTVDRLDEAISGSIKIETGGHCYCCTAGAGSSCTGAIVQ